MPVLFWLDVAAYGMSAVIALALAMTVLGAGPERPLNRSFALFTLIVATWSFLALVLRLGLWLEHGPVSLWSKSSLLFFLLMGPSLLLFVVHYLDCYTRVGQWAVALGFVGCALISYSLFRYPVVLGQSLEADGLLHYQLSTVGGVAAKLFFAYLIVSLLLFRRQRWRVLEPSLALGLFSLTAGIAIYAVFDVHFPVLSFSTAASLTSLGYGVVRRQLFNPLRASEARYRALFEYANDAIFMMQDDCFVDCNPKTLEMFGCRREQIVGQPPYRFSPPVQPDGCDSMQKAMEKIGLAQRGFPQRFDWRHARLDGTPFEAEVSLNRIEVADQVYLLAVVRNITDRKRNADALQESRALFQSLIESLPQNVYSKDLGGRFLFANRRYCAAAGKTLAELVGKTDFDLHPPELAEKYRQDDRRVIETQQLFEIEEMHQILEGECYYVQVIKTPLYDARGQVAGTLGIFWDITERKRAEAEIMRLQHLLQNVTDSMPSALAALDLNGHVLLWNPAAQALTGHPSEQVLGQVLWHVCPEWACYRRLFDQVLRDGQIAHQHNEQATGRAAGVLYRDVSIFPLEANAIEGVVLRIDDVTRRVQVEEAMFHSTKMASIGSLAAGVAHEINNPLGAMMQSAQVLELALDTRRSHTGQRLLSCGVDPDKLESYLQARHVMEYLEGIRATGERAAKIVTDLLSFSRKTSSDFALYDLNDLVDRTLDLAATDYDLKKRYDFRDLEIVRDLSPDLPKVMCDGAQIQQVVLNLVRNAAQAMACRKQATADGESYRPQLTVRTRPGRGFESLAWVRLEVEDNGPGVPEDVQAHLFEPFFTTKGVGEGAGLGLWLCWSIVVERHHGQIGLEPVSTGGARFVLELPLS